MLEQSGMVVIDLSSVKAQKERALSMINKARKISDQSKLRSFTYHHGAWLQNAPTHQKQRWHEKKKKEQEPAQNEK